MIDIKFIYHYYKCWTDILEPINSSIYDQGKDFHGSLFYPNLRNASIQIKL